MLTASLCLPPQPPHNSDSSPSCTATCLARRFGRAERRGLVAHLFEVVLHKRLRLRAGQRLLQRVLQQRAQLLGGFGQHLLHSRSRRSIIITITLTRTSESEQHIATGQRRLCRHCRRCSRSSSSGGLGGSVCGGLEARSSALCGRQACVPVCQGCMAACGAQAASPAEQQLIQEAHAWGTDAVDGECRLVGRCPPCAHNWLVRMNAVISLQLLLQPHVGSITDACTLQKLRASTWQTRHGWSR